MPTQKKQALPLNRKERLKPLDDLPRIDTLKRENLTLLERVAKLQAKLSNMDTRLRILERERKKYGEGDAAEKRLLDLLESFDNEKSL